MKLAGGFFLSIVCGLVGCSSSGGGGGAPAPAPKKAKAAQIPLVATTLKFDPQMDPDRSQSIVEAVSYLYHSPIKDSETEMLRIMKLADAKPETMQAWLQERVTTVVDEDFNAYITVSPTPFKYENPGELPDEPGDAKLSFDPTDERTGKIVMTNIGAGIYAYGKKKNLLFRMNIDGVGAIDFTSPRTGLLQVGEGMFLYEKASYETNQIFHVGTLFHEARHSDGHGKSLAFLHATCPKGHDYEGQAACDRASNGSYTVGALVHKAMMNNCTSCNDARTQMELEAIYLDISSRVLSGDVTIPATATTPEKTYHTVPTDYDDAPEGHP